MKIKHLTSGLLAFGIAASILFSSTVFAEETSSAAADTKAAAAEITTNEIPNWPQGPEISSTASIVMEASTETILYAKNMDQALYPGAAVKVMTTLVALENGKLDDHVIMTATGLAGATDGGAHIAAQLDEDFTLEQCLYAIMLASANDIALQVAEHIGGSVEGFVELMNARAKELGCTDTVFTNPTGMTDENQHTTAHDLALIMNTAIQNESFCSIAAAQSYTIPATNVSGGERTLTNNFSMLDAAKSTYYQGCLGGKEGFTQASLSTLVCAARRNSVTLISVVLQGADVQTEADSIAALDYGFNNFKITDAGKDDFDVISGGNVVLPITADESAISFEDLEDGENILRTYYFQNTKIGTAQIKREEKIDTSIIEENEKNLKEAELFSSEKSYTPYYILGAIAILLFFLSVFGIVKTAKL